MLDEFHVGRRAGEDRERLLVGLLAVDFLLWHELPQLDVALGEAARELRLLLTFVMVFDPAIVKDLFYGFSLPALI